MFLTSPCGPGRLVEVRVERDDEPRRRDEGDAGASAALELGRLMVSSTVSNSGSVRFRTVSPARIFPRIAITPTSASNLLVARPTGRWRRRGDRRASPPAGSRRRKRSRERASTVGADRNVVADRLHERRADVVRDQRRCCRNRRTGAAADGGITWAHDRVAQPVVGQSEGRAWTAR